MKAMSIKGWANRRLFSFYLCVWKCLFFLSFFPSSLTSFSIVPNLKSYVPCLLPSIIGDENLMLFSSVVNPLFFLRTFLGVFFFFLMSSVMKFQDNMSGFFNFFSGYSGLNTKGLCLFSSLQNDLLFSILFFLFVFFFLRYWTPVFVSFLYFFLHSS